MSQTEINEAIIELKTDYFNLEDEGTLEDYLEVKIQVIPNRKIKLSHTLLINQIIKDIRPHQSKASMATPAAFKKILLWNYN